MFRSYLVPFLLIAGSVPGWGAVPVARVISTDPVTIDGITAPGRNYIPVGLGGHVKTAGSSAVLQFRDGTSVVLEAHSELKIDTAFGRPMIRVVKGAALYKLAPNSEISVPGIAPTINLNQKNGNTLAGVAIRQTDSSLPAAATYRASAAATAGMIFPSSPISTVSFLPGNETQIFTAHVANTPEGAAIITPGGVRYNLTTHTNPTTGAITYTIASITVDVSAGGNTTTFNITNTSLVGATVNIGQQLGNGDNAITFTDSSGKTIPPGEVKTTISTAVDTAVKSGQLPTDTKVTDTKPVSQGTFSSTAP